MPLYSYKCPECADVAEILAKSTDRPVVPCETCRATMDRQFPIPNLVTDTTFFAGRPTSEQRGSGFWSPQLNKVIYGRDDVKKTCEQRGWGSEGGVSVKQPESIPDDKPYKVAADVVDREVDRIVSTEYGGEQISQQKRRDLAEVTETRLSGSG